MIGFKLNFKTQSCEKQLYHTCLLADRCLVIYKIRNGKKSETLIFIKIRRALWLAVMVRMTGLEPAREYH